jgi:cell division protein FtsQ
VSKQRKISVKKVMQAALTLVATVGCIVAIVGAARVEESLPVAGVVVHIQDGKTYHFVEEPHVLEETVERAGIEVGKTVLRQVNLRAMEEALNEDDWVENSQVYVDNARVIHISLTQRRPIARLFTQNGNSYYMDSNLHVMPLSSAFIHYCLVITNVPELHKDSASSSIKFQLRTMVNAIQRDTFWSAQASQLVFDTGNTFQIIPLVGDQTIYFGDTSRTQQKLANLLAFYRNVLNRIGWDKYNKIDVRFKNQVVASPAIPYSGPIDKVDKSSIAKMMEAKAREDSIFHALEPLRGSGNLARRESVARVAAGKPLQHPLNEAKAAQPANVKKQEAPTVKPTAAATKVLPKGTLKVTEVAKNKPATPKKEAKPSAQTSDKGASKAVKLLPGAPKQDVAKPIGQQKKKAEDAKPKATSADAKKTQKADATASPKASPTKEKQKAQLKTEQKDGKKNIKQVP